MKDETIAIHAGYTTDPTSHSVTAPIYQTVAYEFDNAQHGADLFDLAVPGNIYSRIMNPTCDVLEQRIAALETSGPHVSNVITNDTHIYLGGLKS